MAFKEYRNPCKSSSSATHEFDIERFSYDVFAYMLQIYRFPEENIPTSSLKKNVYSQADFVMNVGLAVLPIAVYMRDEWRITFEEIFGENESQDISEIQIYAEAYILHSGELDEEDTVTKIQYSLAFYNEYVLYLNFKGIVTDLSNLPKLWSHFCKKLVETSEDLIRSIESALIMSPDLPESWISHFITNFAIPYERSDYLSERFFLSAFPELVSESDTDVSEENFIRTSDISDEDTVAISPEGSDSERKYIFGKWCHIALSGQLKVLEEMDVTETHGRHRNGLNYAFRRCLKRKRSSRCQNLEVEDEFGKINLGTDNISPEKHHTKRRREVSGKETLE